MGMDSTSKILWRLFPSGGQQLSFCGSSSHIICSDDCEVWLGSGSFSDPLRTSTATMQTAQRRKRQNCGSSAQGHHSMSVQNIGHLGLGAMTTEESPNQSGPIFTGVHRVINQGSRLNSRSLPFNGFEPGSSSIARFSFSDGIAPDANWNAASSALQHQTSTSVGSSANSSYAYSGDQNRNPYKRKSSMDTFPGSLTHTTSPGTGESNYVSFTQGPGSRRSDVPFNSASDESGVRREGQDAYYFRNSAMAVNRYDGFSMMLTRDSYLCPSVVQNERAFLTPRRMLPTGATVNESGGSFGLPETLPSRQGNGTSAAGSWRRNITYLEEGSNQAGFFETMRNLNSSSDGNHLGQAPDMIDISAADSWPHQLSNRAIRPAHLREFTSQSSHLPHHLATNPYAYVGTVNIPPPFPAPQPSTRYNNIYPQAVFPPPGSATVMSGMASGPQAAYGDLSSGSMPGQFLPRYNDTSRAPYPRQALRGSRILPSDVINHHRFSASHHELSNQALSYEWVDAHDQHSDMRLDVDNMSYEELLALEERMGNVNTGLTEDSAHKSLKMSTYASTDAIPGVNSQESDTKCSICQEEYMEGDELGELQCGHAYHTDCIRQWLLLKNQCPICKAAAC